MKRNYTHLVNILDRSGSVESVISDMRGGYSSLDIGRMLFHQNP